MFSITTLIFHCLVACLGAKFEVGLINKMLCFLSFWYDHNPNQTLVSPPYRKIAGTLQRLYHLFMRPTGTIADHVGDVQQVPLLAVAGHHIWAWQGLS